MRRVFNLKILEFHGITCRDIASKRVYVRIILGDSDFQSEPHSARLLDFVSEGITIPIHGNAELVKIRLYAVHRVIDEELCYLTLPISIFPEGKIANGLFSLSHSNNQHFHSAPKVALSAHISIDNQPPFHAKRGRIDSIKLLAFLKGAYEETEENISLSERFNSSSASLITSSQFLTKATRSAATYNPFASSKFAADIQFSAATILRQIPSEFWYLFKDQNFIRACVECYVNKTGGYDNQSDDVQDYLSNKPIGYVNIKGWRKKDEQIKAKEQKRKRRCTVQFNESPIFNTSMSPLFNKNATKTKVSKQMPAPAFDLGDEADFYKVPPLVPPSFISEQIKENQVFQQQYQQYQNQYQAPTQSQSLLSQESSPLPPAEENQSSLSIPYPPLQADQAPIPDSPNNSNQPNFAVFQLSPGVEQNQQTQPTQQQQQYMAQEQFDALSPEQKAYYMQYMQAYQQQYMQAYQQQYMQAYQQQYANTYQQQQYSGMYQQTGGSINEQLLPN